MIIDQWSVCLRGGLLAVALTFAGCGTDPAVPDAGSGGDADNSVADSVNSGGEGGMTSDAQLPEVDVESGTGGDIEPSGDVTPESNTRSFRRMTIAQLRASIERVTGGIGWKANNGVDRFAQLGATLGVADYVLNNIEDRSPGLLFHKFLDDAARDVCRQLVEREFAAADASARVFLVAAEPGATDEASVRANVAAARVRFHGIRRGGEHDSVTAWHDLFQTSLATGGGTPEQAWHLVCVGLITHPSFYTY